MKKRYFHEVIEEEEKILAIGLKQSRLHKKERLEMALVSKIKERGKELSILEGHDRLQYLIDIARDVEELPTADKIEENKIRGCASNLWVVGIINKDNTMSYKHDGESYITKGTAKIIIDIVNGESKDAVSKLKLEDFKHLGIRELLTMQRQVGFASLIERIIRCSLQEREKTLHEVLMEGFREEQEQRRLEEEEDD